MRSPDNRRFRGQTDGECLQGGNHFGEEVAGRGDAPAPISVIWKVRTSLLDQLARLAHARGDASNHIDERLIGQAEEVAPLPVMANALDEPVTLQQAGIGRDRGAADAKTFGKFRKADWPDLDEHQAEQAAGNSRHAFGLEMVAHSLDEAIASLGSLFGPERGGIGSKIHGPQIRTAPRSFKAERKKLFSRY
ncbi:MAG: hypothetical protein VYD57_01100 [Pseudomonadota bacterium]|nr:hypothetical protein [Pseudomonadota bacterium]